MARNSDGRRGATYVIHARWWTNPLLLAFAWLFHHHLISLRVMRWSGRVVLRYGYYRVRVGRGTSAAA